MVSLEKLLLFIVIALFLLRVPVVGKYVSLINTLIHEVGHAVVSVLTGGRVDKIELFANTEGVAWSSNRFWIGRVLVSLAGYPAASLASFMFLYLIVNGQYIYMYIILLMVLVISLLFWIRNLYGFFWVITFLGVISLLIYYQNEVLSANILLFIASIVFVEAISSAFVILKLSITQPTDAGDATSLWKSIILIPSPVWGLFFFLQALVFGYLGVSLFI